MIFRSEWFKNRGLWGSKVVKYGYEKQKLIPLGVVPLPVKVFYCNRGHSLMLLDAVSVTYLQHILLVGCYVLYVNLFICICHPMNL